MNRRFLSTAAACLLLAACAHHEKQGDGHGPPLTAEAQAMLARALQRPDASGLVVDLAAYEDTGLGSREDGIKRAAQLVALSLPWLAAGEDDPELQQFFGRLTVSTAVLREWADWPNVRGLAISVPDVAAAAQSGQPPVSQAVVVLAVAQAEEANRQLLQGVMALGRASLAEEHGKEVRFEVVGNDACLVDQQGEPFCVRPGNGFLLMGSQDAMSAYQTSVPAPVAAAESALTATEAQAEPVILHARVAMREQGTANLFVRGKHTLGVHASLESKSPVLLAKAEQVVQEQLSKYDQRRATQLQVLTESLAKMKAALAADPQAPASMKQLVQTITPEQVIDPHGWWQQTRASVKAERVGQRFTVSATLPAGALDALEETLKEGGGAVATVGVLAAIAVPNFVRFQCRSKQSEVKAQLSAIVAAQRAFAADQGRYAKSLKEVGFTADPGSRYVYCLGQQCTECTGPDCPKASAENPCAGLTGVGQTIADGFQVCAYGDPDGDDGLDVWIADDRGAPENGENDCAN